MNRESQQLRKRGSEGRGEEESFRAEMDQGRDKNARTRDEETGL
jgi:hypothetical protein